MKLLSPAEPWNVIAAALSVVVQRLPLPAPGRHWCLTFLPVTRLLTASSTVAPADSVSVSTVPFFAVNDDEPSRSEEIRGAGGGGSALTAAVVPEMATNELAPLDAVPPTRRARPMSPWLSRSLVPVAPVRS